MPRDLAVTSTHGPDVRGERLASSASGQAASAARPSKRRRWRNVMNSKGYFIARRSGPVT